MEREKITVIGIIVVFLMFLTLYFDAEIVRGVSLIRYEILDDFFMGITFVSSGIIIFFFLTSMFLWKEHKKKWILPLWFSLGMSVVISFLLKIAVQRPRPYQLGIVSSFELLEKSSHLVWDFSFPSFQT